MKKKGDVVLLLLLWFFIGLPYLAVEKESRLRLIFGHN